MVADPRTYAGREQAYVKHYFLESYLESLIHKTASRFDEIAYVDGFSGPWQSTGENFEDTSFGIALSALRKAKSSWKARGRDVRMSAYLVEKNPAAYVNLTTLQARYPDIVIHTFNGDFVQIAPTVLAQVPTKAFVFVFIDPKGWQIPMSRLAPLLGRANTEVVFTFMFEFINRAASIGDKRTVDGLAQLMPYGAWREQLEAILIGKPDTPVRRRAALVDGFSTTLTAIGNYPYVAEIPIMRPLRDRIIYSLFYATRHPTGIEVFRNCQIKTLREQSAVRRATKRADTTARTGQDELFGADVSMGPSDIDTYLAAEQLDAEAALIELTPASPETITYGETWPRVLARHAVTHPDVNRMAARLKKDGVLIFSNWASRKHVPDDNYRMARATG